MDKIAPGFAVDAQQIRILKSPCEFFGTLQSHFARALACFWQFTESGKIGDPVRSRVLKQVTGGLVLRSVTTREYSPAASLYKTWSA
ncbi:MAG: hypothetical protein Q9159_004982 [Coniocarpon cinnabarinum]